MYTGIRAEREGNEKRKEGGSDTGAESWESGIGSGDEGRWEIKVRSVEPSTRRGVLVIDHTSRATRECWGGRIDTDMYGFAGRQDHAVPEPMEAYAGIGM